VRRIKIDWIAAVSVVSRSWPARRVLLVGSAALLVIVLIDAWLGGGERSLLQRAMSDETAHLLTAVLFLAAMPMVLPARFVAGALIGAVAIDLDHLPLIAGSDLLTQQTNRPFTHALLTIAIVVGLSMLLPTRWRWAGFGIAAGVAAHFWRDLATSTAGVPLLWPWQTFGFTLPYGLYLGVLIGCVGLAAMRQKRWSRGVRAGVYSFWSR
jgi:inner membrane protein